MKYKFYDAVVVGSGAAGYNCADCLYENGVKNIALITEGKNIGTSRNTGSDKQTYYKLSLSGDEGDSVLDMAQTLFSGGGMDGDVALCEAAGSVRSFMKLALLGMRFPTNAFGEYVGYKTDHDPYSRATSIGPYTSKKMTEVLQAEVERKNIAVLDGLQVVKILKDGDRACGVICVGAYGELSAIQAPCIVLCTGGPASVYYDSVYPLGHTGSSSLALCAGAEMNNLCEWQYGLASTDFRWNVSGTYQQVLPKYISVDKQGNKREFLGDYIEEKSNILKYVFLKGYEWPFDVRKINGSSVVDLAVYNETVVKGNDVYLDFTEEPELLAGGFDRLDETAYNYLKNSAALIPLPIERLKKMNPGAVELYREHGIDIEKEPLKIAVCAQHNNGGVRVDADWQSTVKGLYVCGEAAGTLGIFRPGGTALNSSQVGAARAARHIAYYADVSPCLDFENIAQAGIAELLEFLGSTKGEQSTLACEFDIGRRIMSKHFAFLRNPDEMRAPLGELKERFERFTEHNKWKNNTDIPALFKNLDAAIMQYAVAASILYSAEVFGSRGSGYVFRGGNFMDKNAVPEQNDSKLFAVSAKSENGEITVSRRSVRPIPQRELWFEKVWNEYDLKENRK